MQIICNKIDSIILYVTTLRSRSLLKLCTARLQFLKYDRPSINELTCDQASLLFLKIGTPDRRLSTSASTTLPWGQRGIRASETNIDYGSIINEARGEMTGFLDKYLVFGNTSLV